jgi:hypothetical protein
MIEEPPQPDHSGGATCWQCGAPANPKHAFRFRLVAAPQQQVLDPLGFPVEREGNVDRVIVAVPRCRSCRERGWLAVVIALGATIVGAIVVLLVRSLVWPSSLYVAHEGVGDLAIIIGAVLGFLIGLLCNVLRNRASGLRSLGSYPPLFALRQLGWHYAE